MYLLFTLNIKIMAKQVIDIMPTKGMTTAQSNEHLRKYSEGAYLNMRSNNFDPT